MYYISCLPCSFQSSQLQATAAEENETVFVSTFILQHELSKDYSKHVRDIPFHSDTGRGKGAVGSARCQQAPGCSPKSVLSLLTRVGTLISIKHRD